MTIKELLAHFETAGVFSHGMMVSVYDADNMFCTGASDNTPEKMEALRSNERCVVKDWEMGMYGLKIYLT